MSPRETPSIPTKRSSLLNNPMQIPETLLGGLTPEAFLRDYWQKRPLLIRQALPGFRSHLSGDELAGLSLEPEVESRLVIEKDGERPWQVIHGPQDEAVYGELPDNHWTLLVQEVNRHLPEVAELFDLFAFIPAWRLDDIMVSYAEDQGSVGPHVDNYDVFLLQAEGTRRWQISAQQQVNDEDLIPDIEMRIMREFHAEEEWLLEPGDMLYLPPNVPHYGVAQGECITYSVGFRAPTVQQMWSHYLEYLLQHIPDRFYTDPDLQASNHPGRIDGQAMDKVRELIRVLPTDDARIDDWFGRFITDPVRGVGPEPLDPPLQAEELRKLLRDGETLYRSEETRFAYFESPDGPHLYINGQRVDAPGSTEPELLRLIADRRHYDMDDLSPYLTGPNLDFLMQMCNQGYLGWLEEIDDGD